MTSPKKRKRNSSQEVCLQTRCRETPRYNFPESRIRIYCKKHKKEGMKYLRNRRQCLETNCDIIPYFNFPGEKKRLYCSIHRKPEMINVTDTRSLFPKT